MEIASINSSKKWLLGVNGSRCPVEIGFFATAEDKLHYHEKVFEYYLAFSGKLILLIDKKRIELKTGDVCCVEPGERHMFMKGSRDLKCFLVKLPHLPNDKVIC